MSLRSTRHLEKFHFVLGQYKRDSPLCPSSWEKYLLVFTCQLLIVLFLTCYAFHFTQSNSIFWQNSRNLSTLYEDKFFPKSKLNNSADENASCSDHFHCNMSLSLVVINQQYLPEQNFSLYFKTPCLHMYFS